MYQIVFCTSNKNKLIEAEHILGVRLKQADIDLDEIQEMDLEKIIKHKVREAYQRLKRPVMVEDAGLYLDAWKGFPGPFVKFLQRSMGYQKMADALPKNITGVTWIVAYGFYNGKTMIMARGQTRGSISKIKKGQSDFGFDPWFIPLGSKKTYAQMTMAEKSKTSARQQALVSLRQMIAPSAD